MTNIFIRSLLVLAEIQDPLLLIPNNTNITLSNLATPVGSEIVFEIPRKRITDRSQ